MLIPSNYYPYINIFIILIFVLMVIFGYHKGFLYELIHLLYSGLSIAIAWLISPVLASLYPIIKLEEIYPKSEFISKFMNINPMINIITYFLIIFLVLKVFYLFLAFVLRKFNKVPIFGKFNQLIGGLFGVINAALIVLALSMLLSLPIFKNGQEVKNNTLFAYVNDLSNKTFDFALKNIDVDSIKAKFDNFDVDSARDDIMEWLKSQNNE